MDFHPAKCGAPTLGSGRAKGACPLFLACPHKNVRCLGEVGLKVRGGRRGRGDDVRKLISKLGAADGGMNYALLMGATFAFYAFNNVETSAMPSYAMEMGGSAFIASAQTSLFIVAAVILRFAFGPMSDRRGPRFMMIVGALGFTLPCVLLPFCTELWQMLSLRAIQAVGLAAFHPCVSLAVSCISQPGVLGTRMGSLRFVSTLSLMVGPALLFPLIDQAGYRVFFGMLCLVGFVGLVLLGVFDDGRPAGDAADDSSGRREAWGSAGPASLARRFAPLLAYPFVCAFGYGAMLNFGKMLVADVMPALNDGLVFTFVSAGGLIGSLSCGRLVDGMGVRGTVAGALGFAGTGLLVLGAAREAVPFALGGVAFGAGYFGAITALTAALAAKTDDGCRGSALSLQQSCLDVGLAAGSLLAGAIVQATASVSFAFWSMALVVVLSVPVWLGLCRKEA